MTDSKPVPSPEFIGRAADWLFENQKREGQALRLAELLMAHEAEAVKKRDEEWNKELFSGWLIHQIDGPADAVKRRKSMWEEGTDNLVNEAVKATTEELKWCGVVPGEKGCGDRCMECLRDRANYEAAMTTRECEARERAEKERDQFKIAYGVIADDAAALRKRLEQAYHAEAEALRVMNREREDRERAEKRAEQKEREVAAVHNHWIKECDQLKAEVEKLTEEKEQSEGQCETVSRAYIREQEQGASLRKRVEELEANIKGRISLHAQELEVSGQTMEQARREGVKAERQRMASTAGGLGAELLDEARREGAEEMRERAARTVDESAAHGGQIVFHACRTIRALPLDPPKAQESERVTIPVIRADGVGAITLTMEEFGEVQARVYHRDLRACQHTTPRDCCMGDCSNVHFKRCNKPMPCAEHPARE